MRANGPVPVVVVLYFLSAVCVWKDKLLTGSDDKDRHALASADDRGLVFFLRCNNEQQQHYIVVLYCCKNE